MQKVIDNRKGNQFPKVKKKELVLGIDATYFRDFVVTVLRSIVDKINPYWRFTEKETVEGYLKGIEVLEAKGHKIKAVVCDNFSGLTKALEKRGILVQTCQWHVMKAIQRKTTLRPKTQAGKELLGIAKRMTKVNKAEFTEEWIRWERKWEKYLSEKSVNIQTGEVGYTHERLRSARRMLRQVYPNLFVYEDYEGFNIPRTNNSIEGIFSYLKGKVKIHRGLKRERKQKLIEQVLSRLPT